MSWVARWRVGYLVPERARACSVTTDNRLENARLVPVKET